MFLTLPRQMDIIIISCSFIIDPNNSVINQNRNNILLFVNWNRIDILLFINQHRINILLYINNSIWSWINVLLNVSFDHKHDYWSCFFFGCCPYNNFVVDCCLYNLFFFGCCPNNNWRKHIEVLEVVQIEVKQ